MPPAKPDEPVQLNAPLTGTSISDHDRDLLTVAQAARLLHLSESSVRTYIRQGDLKAFRVAGLRKVLIPRDELNKLLSPV